MKKTYIVFGLFILISVLWLLNDWQSGDWRKGLSQNAEPELQAIEPGESPGLSFSASSGYKEFVSSDGKLKIKYPNSWLAVANQGLFTAASPEEWREKYNLETTYSFWRKQHLAKQRQIHRCYYRHRFIYDSSQNS